MLRRDFLGSIAVASAGLGRRQRPASRPNVILIVSDDLGYADLSGFGRRDYRTPVLDRFGAEGIRLTQAYSAAPVCSPTRVGLMTGRYPARLPVGLPEPLASHRIGLAPGQSVLAHGFKSRGYRTALIGKWHLGTAPAYHPLRHGFDEFYGFLGPAMDYASHRGMGHGADFFEGTTPVRTEGYLTELFTARAVRFVDQAKRGPFFLSLQYNAPHWPWQGPGDPAYADSVGWTTGGSPAVFARMVETMDRGVGAILDRLAVAGVDRDTLVIFTSDNGGERFSDMGGLRDSKFSLWEGGIRVAAMARWPGVIPPGRTTDQAAITMDWTRTALGVAGAGPEWIGHSDGIDLLPVLRGTAPAAPRTLFWRTILRTQHRAVRRGWWKYLRIKDREYLFDLETDPGEAHDRSREEAGRAAALRAAYAVWDRAMVDPALAPQAAS